MKRKEIVARVHKKYAFNSASDTVKAILFGREVAERTHIETLKEAIKNLDKLWLDIHPHLHGANIDGICYKEFEKLKKVLE